MMEATARPWHYFSGSHGLYGGPELRTCIAIVKGPHGDDRKQNLNAAFILRAVRIVDALEKYPDLPDEIRAMLETEQGL